MLFLFKQKKQIKYLKKFTWYGIWTHEAYARGPKPRPFDHSGNHVYNVWNRDWTDDLSIFSAALSQLSYLDKLLEQGFNNKLVLVPLCHLLKVPTGNRTQIVRFVILNATFTP